MHPFQKALYWRYFQGLHLLLPWWHTRCRQPIQCRRCHWLRPGTTWALKPARSRHNTSNRNANNVFFSNNKNDSNQEKDDGIIAVSAIVFNKKRDSEGNVIKYKARVVAKGYSQQNGIDYNETSLPAVRYSSMTKKTVVGNCNAI